MPDSITVAAFVFGLVLLIAAFVGKELKIAAVEMPALNRRQRFILGGLGVFLVLFGLTEGQWFRWVDSPALPTATIRADSPPTATGGQITSAVPLPNDVRNRVVSIRPKYGCAILFGSASSLEDQLRICADSPTLPAERSGYIHKDEGHSVSLFLAGDAVQLVRDAILDHLVGLGTGKLREHYDAIVTGGGRFYLSGLSAKARGVTDADLQGKPAEFAMPNVLVRLSLESDRTFTY